MSAAAMAAFEARVGTALIRRLANASGDFGGGLVVEGCFDDPSSIQQLGSIGAIERDPTFDVLEADLNGRELARDEEVTITHGTEVTLYRLRLDPVKSTLHKTLSMALQKVIT
jgi:hypothetical protein